MAVYTISDLHLALSTDKPMDIFGDRWQNYMEKLKKAWWETVGPEDHVIIPGDISWATYLDQAIKDFQFIEDLPGRKIISKGNHDYWWTTASKLDAFKERNGFRTISFMHNNSFLLEDLVVCGTRGWKCPGEDEFSAEDMKIYKRELLRLEMSLKAAPVAVGRKIVVAMHYPPFSPTREPSEFVRIMKDYGVAQCVYGHLHGLGFRNAQEGVLEGIHFKLVSADYLNFVPFQLVK